MKTSAPIVEEKMVRHNFTPEESNELGGELARQLASFRGIESEFDQVKASFKSKLTECTARIDRLQTNRLNGFEMRTERCRVRFAPSERKKYWYQELSKDDENPVLVEEMNQDDFHADLIQAEGVFECRKEMEIFPRAGQDYGLLIIGRLDGKWFSAIRLVIGSRKLSERLDSEQPCTKQRYDAVQKALKRLNKWLVESLGKDAAAGFVDHIANLSVKESEVVE